MIVAPLASAEFQDRFMATMERVGADTSAALESNLACLWLGGGFGRGEGAVVRNAGVEQAYNDVDLFLFVHDAARVDDGALKRIEERYTAQLGAHLEFSQPIEVRRIPSLHPAHMWFDALHGHRVIAGKDVEREFSREVWRAFPISEGPRLLLNRAAGLIWATRVFLGLEAAPDPDFVRRNCWKARLALMEATLIVGHRYVPTVLEGTPNLTPTERKRLAFNDLAAAEPFRSALLQPEEIAKACRFKQDPDAEHETQDALEVAQEFEGAFREIEERRYQTLFASPKTYVDFDEAREPSEHLVRNLAKNLRHGRLSLEHPRQPLYAAAVRLLHGDSQNWSQESHQFLGEWRRFC